MIDGLVMLSAVLSGAAIGLILGLVGGGGSILAVPLLVHVVGIRSPHVAIGTAAIAVGLNAAMGLVGHARHGNVNWRCGAIFAATGVAGALTGAALGKAYDGQKLLFLFGSLMVIVGLSMLRKRNADPRSDIALTSANAGQLVPRLAPAGLGVGLLSGFFGIGGGFLIVPGLIWATRMPITKAVGTSLLAVTAFGLSTAASYALSGLVDWPIVGLMIIGGVVGATAGIALGRRLAGRKRLLETAFGIMVIVVGVYVALKAR
ncbi:sulfite exporter TauE/SafE family protein [Sphingomonas sp.]|uniref:sulfite exporter TauE/SafE family protein n=1 Tax=Sphingomonas sp. TaxID=28214 RepID=UPI00286C84A4|nr:sulfite exporter TauE/SafE family protein [Sphingomonas sp.]